MANEDGENRVIARGKLLEYLNPVEKSAGQGLDAVEAFAGPRRVIDRPELQAYLPFEEPST